MQKLNNSTNFNDFHSNVNGLENKMDLLLEFPSSISSDFDVVAITETFQRNNAVKAYNNYFTSSYSEKGDVAIYTKDKYTDENLGASGKRGVAIYVKDDVNCTAIHLETVHEDHVWIEINLHSGDKLLCGCIYRSPTNLKHETIKTTSTICDVISEAVQRNSSYLLICSDFKYPKIDWTHEYAAVNSDITPFLDTIQNSYLTQHVLQPTKYRGRDEPIRIDLVLTNENGMINETIHVVPLGDSDHEFLMFSFQCYKDILKRLGRELNKSIGKRFFKVISQMHTATSDKPRRQLRMNAYHLGNKIKRTITST